MWRKHLLEFQRYQISTRDYFLAHLV